MGKHNQFDLGSISKEKENFIFTHNNSEYVRHSEYAIKKLVKELGLSYVYIIRDRDYWSVFNNLTQQWMYTPRY